MIALWLIVAHLCGDYHTQTRWQAVGKFGWTDEAIRLRLRHCAGYYVCFIPVAAIYADTLVYALLFLGTLAFAHFMTDAQRFLRTPGEWITWRFMSPSRRADEHKRRIGCGGLDERMPMMTERPPDDVHRKLPLPPNPWPSMPLAIDQTLHVIQIAVLAQVFLR